MDWTEMGERGSAVRRILAHNYDLYCRPHDSGKSRRSRDAGSDTTYRVECNRSGAGLGFNKV
jgi:hypothetical protein